MSKSFRQLYLSLSGRLPRSVFNWSFIAVLICFVILFVFVEAAFGRPNTLVLYPFMAWACLALATKRLHDRGQSMLWLLLLIIPLIGPLWCFITLCCRVGSQGENQYGDDILSRSADYLTVK